MKAKSRITIIITAADKKKLDTVLKKQESNTSIFLRGVIRNYLKGLANEPKINS
jgi:hypothetical protein